MVLGVAGGVGHAEGCTRGCNPLPALQCMDIRGRHRQERPPQGIHLIPIQPRGACQQLCRVHHVRRTAFMNMNLDRRHALDDGPDGAGVIEVDVGDQQGAHVAQRQAALPQPGFEGGQARRRPGVDERDAIGPHENSGRDHAIAAAEIQIDVVGHSLNDSDFMVSA